MCSLQSCGADKFSSAVPTYWKSCVDCGPTLVVQVRTEVWQPACIIDRVLCEKGGLIACSLVLLPLYKTIWTHIGPTTFDRTQFTEPYKKVCTSLGCSCELSPAQIGELESVPRRFGLGITVHFFMLLRS